MSTKKSSAFTHVVGGSNQVDSTATPPSSLSFSSSSSPDAGGGPLRIVSRSSSPNCQTTQTKPSSTQSVVSSLPAPPPLHPQIPPPSLIPGGHTPVVGPSNIIIHSQNLNHFPFVTPTNQYGLLTSPLNSAGQPQTIILNQCGQPVGFVSPTSFYPQPPGSSSASICSTSGSTSGSAYPRPPVLMTCRPAPPLLGPQPSSSNAGSTNLPLFPTQMYPATYAFPTYNNPSLLLPTGQFLCRTPQGQLIGFQIPTNIAQQSAPVDPQTMGSGKLQPVLPKPGSIFPISGAAAGSRSTAKAVVTPAQMIPLAPTIGCHSAAMPAPATASASTTNVIVKTDPETPVAAATIITNNADANTATGKPPAAPVAAGLPQTCVGNDLTTVTASIPEVVDFKNELTAAEIHAMFLQEVENMPATDRPQVLTHFIDGFVIQESLEPFPLSPIIFDEFPMLIQPSAVDWSAPPQLTPEERVTPPASLVPDSCSAASSASVCLRCERELNQSNRYEPEPNFCSKNCFKSYQRRRANSDTSSSTNKNNKSTKRQKTDQNTNDNTPRMTSPSTTSSPKRISDTPSELPSTSNSFTLEEPSPPLVSDKSPGDWTVDDVHAWLLSLGPGVAQYVGLFRQQEIDGQALLLLQEDHLVRQMGLKLGPAVKICAALKNLRG